MEEDLRAAFARHEHLVPDPDQLRESIGRAVVRRRRRRLVVRVAGVLLAVLALVLPGYGLRLVGDPGNDVVRQSDLLGELLPPPRAMDILVLGLDTKQRSPALADLVLLVHIPADRDRAYLLSLPRDLVVSIPASPDNGYPGGKEKLSQAFALGSLRKTKAADLAAGARLTSAALNRLTGLAFDAVATVEFSALRAITDAVGGVRLCLDQRIWSVHTKRIFPAGCQRLDGDSAMDLLRQRYGLKGGAQDRDRNGRKFVTALVSAVRSAGGPGDPGTVERLLRAAGTGLAVDPGAAKVVELLGQTGGIDAADIVGLSLPVTDGPAAKGSPIPGLRFADQAQAEALFRAYSHDRTDEWLARYPKAAD